MVQEMQDMDPSQEVSKDTMRDEPTPFERDFLGKVRKIDGFLVTSKKGCSKEEAATLFQHNLGHNIPFDSSLMCVKRVFRAFGRNVDTGRRSLSWRFHATRGPYVWCYPLNRP